MSTAKYCHLRAPSGAASAKHFGVALVQEVERIHDLEPVFFPDFDRFVAEDTLTGKAEEKREPTRVPALGNVQQRASTSLNSPEFVFRVLKLLRHRGSIAYDVPTVSPIAELDEDIIEQCREDVRQEQIRKELCADSSGTDSDGGEESASATPQPLLSRFANVNVSNDERNETRDQAKQFELLQQRLVKRWEAKVQQRWLAMQPLYVSEESLDGLVADGDLLRGPSVSLAFFSHIDILTYCILDLFKCAAAKGPGGNTGDWNPYLQYKNGANNSSTSGVDAETTVRTGGVDAVGKPLMETLTWTRLVMYLADCSPQTQDGKASIEGIRVFLPPKAARLLPPAGSSLAANENDKRGHGRRITTLERFHVQAGASYELTKVRIAKLWKEKGVSILLTSPPKDGSECESIHFIHNHSMRCLRIQQLSHRHGNVLHMELIPFPHNSLACAFIDGVRLYDLETFGLKAFVAEPETVTAMRYIPSIDRLVIGNKVGDLRFYSSLDVADKRFVMSRTSEDQESSHSKEGGGGSYSEQTIASNIIACKTYAKHHSEGICDISDVVLNENILTTTGLDKCLGFFNLDTQSGRRAHGNAVALGAVPIPSLGLLFCFGVDLWPFVWSYNVLNSKPLSLAGGGTPVGSRSAVPESDSLGSERRHHGARIVAVYALEAPKHSAVSLDRNGGVRIWDLWKMCLLQSIDIASSYAGTNAPYFKNKSGCVSAFTNFLFDPTRIRFYSFFRQRSFTLRYNHKDDLRTTRLASFEQILKVHILSNNRLLVAVSRKSVTVWDLVTAREVTTISVPQLFASHLAQVHATSQKVLIADESDDGDGSDGDGGESDGGNERLEEASGKADGRGQRSKYAGLDIVSTQIVEDSRCIFLGFSCGGIVLCSLGNGSPICFIPPVPFFYGGNGLLSEEGLTAGQEIAAAARFAGDFSLLYYHAPQDTLFMSGAGHTFYEFRGQRYELLAGGSTSVDASIITFHQYTGSILIAETSGVVSVWVQQDHLIHNDLWLRVAHTSGSAVSADTVCGLLEVPNTPYFISNDSVGVISLYRLEMDLSFAKDEADPTGYFLWPGANTEGADTASPKVEHRRFFTLRRRLGSQTVPSSDSNRKPQRQSSRSALLKSSDPTVALSGSRRAFLLKEKEMSGSMLKKYHRQHVSIERRRTTTSVAVPNRQSNSNRASDRLRSDVTLSFGGPLTKSDVLLNVSSSESEGEVSQSVPAPVNAIETAGEAGKKRVKARLALLRNVALTSITSKRGDVQEEQTAESTEDSFHGGSHAKALGRSNRRGSRLSAAGTSSVASNSVICVGLCARWAHVCVNPCLQDLPARLETVMVPVTSMAFSQEYSFLYVGDLQGYVSIYDLSLATASPVEITRWSGFAKKAFSQEAPHVANPPLVDETQDAVVNPLPTFSSPTHFHNSLLNSIQNKTISCVRRSRLHTSAVTSIIVTEGAFGSVFTSGPDGTVQAWSLFLQKQCGALALGERTAKSVFRYPHISTESRLGETLLQVFEIFPSSSEKEKVGGSRKRSSNRLGADTGAEQQTPLSFKGATRTPRMIAKLREQPVPLVMLPSQIVFPTLEFAEAAREESTPSSRACHTSDVGGPCQQSAADACNRETVNSFRLQMSVREPPHVQRAGNNATKATLKEMTPSLFAQFESILLNKIKQFEQQSVLMLQLAETSEKEGGGRVEEGIADTHQASGRIESLLGCSSSRDLYLTMGGIVAVLLAPQNRCSVYDDVPLPYNSCGAMDVLQFPAFAVISIDTAKSGDPRASIFPSLLSPESSTMSLDVLNSPKGLHPSPYARAGGRSEQTNVEAVVNYKDWCLSQQLLLDGFAAGVSGGTNGKSAQLLSEAKRPRMHEMVKIFQSLHCASVADVEKGARLPIGVDGTAKEASELPSILDRRSRFGRSVDRANVNHDENQRGGASPVKLIEDQITLSCNASSHKPQQKLLLSSQQVLNLKVEERHQSTVAGHPPQISVALMPSRGAALARVKTSRAEDERGLSSEGDSSSDDEEMFQEDEWKAILDHQRVEREKLRNAKKALEELKAECHKPFQENKSKVALLSTIQNEDVLDGMVRVFSKGDAHSTLAFMLAKEHDERSSRGKRSASLALEANRKGEVSHDVVQAYCETFSHHDDTKSLFDNTYPLSSKVGRNGDTSSLRPEISKTAVVNMPAHRRKRLMPIHGTGVQSPDGGGGRGSGPMTLTGQSANAHELIASPYQSLDISRGPRIGPGGEATASSLSMPLGRPVSPYLLRKCTHDAFKTMLSNRTLETAEEVVQQRRMQQQQVSLPEISGRTPSSVTRAPPPTMRLKNGLLPGIPLQAKGSRKK